MEYSIFKAQGATIQNIGFTTNLSVYGSVKETWLAARKSGRRRVGLLLTLVRRCRTCEGEKEKAFAQCHSRVVCLQLLLQPYSELTTLYSYSQLVLIIHRYVYSDIHMYMCTCPHYILSVILENSGTRHSV